MKRRLDRLEPATLGKWYAAWEAFRTTLQRNTQQEWLDHARSNATNNKPTWEAFLTEYGLTELAAWADALVLPNPEGKGKLAHWPAALPVPPVEPPAVRAGLQEIMSSASERGGMAAFCRFILGLAETVREHQ